MVFNLILALLLSTGLVPNKADTPSTFVQHTTTQADYYMTQLKEGNNKPLHYWALAQLARSNDSLETYLDTYSQSPDLPTKFHDFLYPSVDNLPYTKGFTDYQIRIASIGSQLQSPLLFVELLSSIGSISKRKEVYNEYKSLLRLSSQGNSHFSTDTLLYRLAAGKQITYDNLPKTPITLAHFAILTRNEDLLAPDYFQEIHKHWKQFIEDPPSPPAGSLSEALKIATLVRISYEARQMSSIVRLHNLFADDDKFPNCKFKMDLYKALDLGAYRLGYYDKPLQLHEQKSIPLARFLGDRYSEYYFMKHQGIFLYQLGKIEKAQQVYQEVLKGLNTYDIPMNKVDILNNLGLTYYKTGYYDEYVNYLSQALSLAEKNKNYNYQLEIYRNFHIYHRKNKNWATAREYLNKYQKLVKSHGETKDLAAVYITTATYYRDFNTDYEKAAIYLDRTEKLVNPDNYYNQFVRLVSEKAKLHRDQNEPMKALHHFNRLRRASKEKSDTPDYLFSLIQAADIHIQLQQYEKAGRLIDKIYQYDTDILYFDHLVQLRGVEAQLAHHAGDTEKALSIIRPAIEQIIERAQNSSDIRSGYWHIESEYIDVLKTGVDLLLYENQEKQALKLLDRIKTINDAELYKNPIVKAERMTDEELSKEQRINDKLNDLRKDYLNAENDQKLALKSQINKLKADRNQLYGDLSALDQSDSFTIREIQHDLSYTHLIIHVTELKDTFYISYVSSNSVEIEQVQLNDQLRSLFETSIQKLVDSETDLNKLYSVFTALRLHDLPNYIKRVSLIPDSYLYRLPLEILPVTAPEHPYSYGSTTYFVEDYIVNYHTSLQEHTSSYTTNGSYELDFAGYGITRFPKMKKQLVPLPYADQEINNILRQLSRIEQKKKFINADATEVNFRKYASKSRIIHLATHSSVNNREPLFSSIYLHNEATDSDFNSEGRIFAYELFEMNLNNQLIMMNSCESGSGPYLQGSGVMGLSRSLKYAGGNSLILNLWSVNDKYAADFATQLYHYLNEGMDKAEAMRKAKIYFLQQSNANPHYWGPYMLLGNPAPLIHKGFSFFRFFIFGSVIFLLTAGISILYSPKQR